MLRSGSRQYSEDAKSAEAAGKKGTGKDRKNMSFFKNKPVLIVIAVVVLSAIIALVSHLTDRLPARMASGVITPVEKVVYKMLSPVINLSDGIKNGGKYAEENEQLRAQIDELIMENRSVEDYLEENKRLRELLGIKEAMVNCRTVAAEVIAYDWDNFSETVVINRGSSDGLELEDAVITAEGVVGRVTELGKGWARITTLISPKHFMGVRISRTGDLAVAEGEAELAPDRKLRLGYISGAAKVIEGDIIETSGVGGIYPPGIAVGKVTEVSVESSGTVAYAVVEPSAPLEKVKEVLVITDWSKEIEDVTGENIPSTIEISDEEIANAEG